jgi:hypothetical protein
MKEGVYLVSSRNSFPADVLDLTRSYIVTALFGLPVEEPVSEDTFILSEMQVTQHCSGNKFWGSLVYI